MLNLAFYLLDIFFFFVYYILMKKTFVEYISKNGFRFHHSVSYTKNTEFENISRAETHYQYELFYLLSGRVQYDVDGRGYSVSPGDILLLAPESLHCLTIKHDKDNYQRMVLHFSPELLPHFQDFTFFDSLNDDAQLFPKSIVEQSNLPTLLKRFSKISTTKNHYLDLHLYKEVLSIVEELDKLLLFHYHQSNLLFLRAIYQEKLGQTAFPYRAFTGTQY